MVRFGDDSRIEIKVKGSVWFLLRDGGKKVLNNVYFIPGLKSNIISLGQATEVGCEVRTKDEILTLYDRNGELVVRTRRSKNRLYKVIIEVKITKCLQLESTKEMTVWHAWLGHVNYETMKTMANKELVAGIPKILGSKETCASCLRGKQTRRAFPQATGYRATKALELIHGSLWSNYAVNTSSEEVYICDN